MSLSRLSRLRRALSGTLALLLGLGLVSGLPAPASAHIGEYAGPAGSFPVGGGSSQSMSVVRVVRETDGLYWVKFQKQAPESVDRTGYVWFRIGSCIVQASGTSYSRVFFGKNQTTTWATNYLKDPSCDPGWVDVADQSWAPANDATRSWVRWSESGPALDPLAFGTVSGSPVAAGSSVTIDFTLNHSSVGPDRLR